MEGQANNDTTQAPGGLPAGSDQPTIPSTDPAGPPVASGEDMHRGWVKLWRKWRDHEMASDPNATLVFLHLLTEARREPKVNRRYGYTLERGQCDLTLGKLSELTKLSVKSVRGALDRLERYETIKRGTQQGKQPAIITIVNFDTYNPDTGDKGNQQGCAGADKGQLPEKGKKVENTTAVELPKELEPYKTAVEDWLAYKREKGQTYKPRGLKTLYGSMIELGAGLPAAVKHSMANNYTGLFSPSGNGKPTDRSTAVSAQHQRGLDSDEYGL